VGTACTHARAQTCLTRLRTVPAGCWQGADPVRVVLGVELLNTAPELVHLDQALRGLQDTMVHVCARARVCACVRVRADARPSRMSTSGARRRGRQGGCDLLWHATTAASHCALPDPWARASLFGAHSRVHWQQGAGLAIGSRGEPEGRASAFPSAAPGAHPGRCRRPAGAAGHPRRAHQSIPGKRPRARRPRPTAPPRHQREGPEGPRSSAWRRARRASPPSASAAPATAPLRQRRAAADERELEELLERQQAHAQPRGSRTGPWLVCCVAPPSDWHWSVAHAFFVSEDEDRQLARFVFTC